MLKQLPHYPAHHRKPAPIVLGWCEWCQLPQLGLPAVKAKIDTGAATSALHAFDTERFRKRGKDYARFWVHPLQGDLQTAIQCRAEIIDRRSVMSSNGHKENRFVIKTALVINERTWDIELTLSNRDPLKFRMLLGLSALKKQAIIFPDKRLYQGTMSKKELIKAYKGID